MSTKEQEKHMMSQSSQSSKPRFRTPSQPSRPAWAIAWSKGESVASRSERFAPPPASSYQSSNRDTTPIRSVSPVWDEEEGEINPTTSKTQKPPQTTGRAAEIIERPSSRLSDHLTQDQQDRQAMSNDMAGRRALPAIRNDPISTPTAFESPKEVTSSAVTVHGWEDDDAASSTRKASSQTHIGPGYPRLKPSRVYEEMLKRETIRPPVFGGRSKNMQLGSVAESWGKAPTLEIPRGMFQLDDDPPSPPPGVDMTPAEIQAEKARRAMLGIPGEKSGRPSIKDMEKEIMDKMKRQKLTEERVRSEVNVRNLHPADTASVMTTGWDGPTKQNNVQPKLSERLRERDVYNNGRNQDDGW